MARRISPGRDGEILRRASKVKLLRMTRFVLSPSLAAKDLRVLFLRRASRVEDGPKNLTSAVGTTLVILSGPDPVVAKDLYSRDAEPALSIAPLTREGSRVRSASSSA